MESSENGLAHEEITQDIASTLPTFWSALARNKFSRTAWITDVIAIVMMFMASRWGSTQYKVLFVSVLILAIAARWLPLLFGIRLYARNGLEGWIFAERDGRFVAIRNGVERVACAMSECQWVQIPDLRKALENGAFPTQSAILIVPHQHGPLQWLFSGHPFFICGLTETSQAMWRRRFLANGATETIVPTAN